jgi:hypothetical protein
MRLEILEIQTRKRTNSTQVVSAGDFALRKAHAEYDESWGTRLGCGPDIAPYCLDHDRGYMMFAETPTDVDISTAPFYYQAQFETATRLVGVPYRLAHELALRVGLRLQRLVFIYSMGRSGSTLVSKMWQRVDETLSLSEPDVFTDISRLRAEGRLTDGQSLQLLGTSVRLVHKPRTECKVLAIKFRGRCIEMAELLHWLFPVAASLFIYRNAVDCIESYLRVFGEEPFEETSFRRMFPLASPVASEIPLALGRLAQPLLNWVGSVQQYLGLRARGVSFAALRYESLVRAPKWSADRLFDYCGCPELPADRIDDVMAADPQAGTKLARNAYGKRLLTDAELERIRSFLELHMGMCPDAVLPGTIN